MKSQWFQILLALADGERHGLGIMKEVLAQTDGRVRLWPVTLYGSLRRLTNEGLIVERPPEDGPADEGDRRRFYAITPAGRRALGEELSRLAGYLDVARRKRVPAEPR